MAETWTRTIGLVVTTNLLAVLLLGAWVERFNPALAPFTWLI